jgi:hypothetical protein
MVNNRSVQIVLFFTLLTLGIFLRVYHLGNFSLFSDERSSVLLGVANINQGGMGDLMNPEKTFTPADRPRFYQQARRMAGSLFNRLHQVGQRNPESGERQCQEVFRSLAFHLGNIASDLHYQCREEDGEDSHSIRHFIHE